ncbi:MAG: 50S ribosomal protein L10 [Bacteroidales bacterium]|nr:50S ribosomal protein L10 [Bacteroidales bacterium]
MKTNEKAQIIDSLTEIIKEYGVIYLADISGFNAVQTSNLRRECFKRDIKLVVVKNTLLIKAMEKTGIDFSELQTAAKGSTSILLSKTANAPALLIKEFRKKQNLEKPLFKGAYAQESTYLGENQLEALVNIKSKEQLIGDVLSILQSPMQNLMSALQSGGSNIAGLLKTLSEKE